MLKENESEVQIFSEPTESGFVLLYINLHGLYQQSIIALPFQLVVGFSQWKELEKTSRGKKTVARVFLSLLPFIDELYPRT